MMRYTPTQISQRELEKQRDSHFNLMNSHSFKDMVKYITSLKNEQIIDDNVFSELLVHSCAIYIENQIEKKISTSISNIFFTTSHMMERLK
ncbi:MAG: hypothetical protein SCH39_01250 [Methanosarcinales archaeon]|nr:hypothetical protein [Methanosarcinales archaeon]